MRILLVEDDAALARVLGKGLGEQGYAVDPVASSRGAQRLLRENPYDLVLLDLGLPDGDGLSLVQGMRARGEPTPVLVLTARGTIADRVKGLDSGADDYLQKPFAFPELLARVRALLRRGMVAAPTSLCVGDVEIDPAKLTATRGGIPIQLTVKEFAILHYLVRHAGQLVTRTMLLEHCWDESYDGLSNLVDVHVSHLRRKLEPPGTAPLVRTVRGAGFIFGDGVK
jgi:two-component system OmpR family response regulator